MTRTFRRLFRLDIGWRSRSQRLGTLRFRGGPRVARGHLPRRDGALAAVVLQHHKVNLISCEQLDLIHLCNQVRITRSTTSVCAHEPLAHILRVQLTVSQQKYTLRPRHLSTLLAPLDTMLREPAQCESDPRLNHDRQQLALRGHERESHHRCAGVTDIALARGRHRGHRSNKFDGATELARSITKATTESVIVESVMLSQVTNTALSV